MTTPDTETLPASNPFAEPSALPYGIPPYDEISVADYRQAIEVGMARQSAEIEAIGTNTEPPTFANTVEALERSGGLLRRALRPLLDLVTAHGTEEVHAVHNGLAPALAEHHDAIYLDRRVYDRIEAVGTEGLDAEQLRLLERYRTDFVRAGVHLGEPEQARLREINAELSRCASTFLERLVAGADAAAVVVDDVTELAGAPQDVVDAAATAATERGLPGKYVLDLLLPTQQPLLATLENPELRDRLFEASVRRGQGAAGPDNRPVATRMVALRAERARLLGYASHADYAIADQVAGSAGAAREMLESLVPAAVANARAEIERLGVSTPDGVLRPPDRAYYAERRRKELYAVDDADLRPYFELERVLHDGVFFAAGRLYGIGFTERHDLPLYHPDVRAFDVTDADGSPLGLFLADYYTRREKSGGAWMNALVEQSGLLGTLPVVTNNLNIRPPRHGRPTLLRFDEVRTMFHEFGHALHGLFSDVRYPSLSGTNVPRDFVEFPSQVNEMWALWPEVLANYARHHETGEPMPDELVGKLVAAKEYDQGFATTEYLAAALLDLSWHGLAADEVPEDVAGYEARALDAAGLAVPEIPPRYRTAYFKHLFASGYAAGYYSYIFSEVLDADTVEWFRENGGLRRENGERFRTELLSKGFSVDPNAAYRAFRGRDPEIAPLLRRRNLTTAG